MLITLEELQSIPGLTNIASAPTGFLNNVALAADKAIKTYLKRDIEMTVYDEIYSGENRQDICLRQFPVWMGNTTVSNGATLPTATITVASTVGFHPGTGGDTVTTPLPTLLVQTGTTTYTTVTYTGTTSTTFTGCSGGTGTIVSGYRIFSPAVFYNQGAYYGQAASPWGDGTIMTPGGQYAIAIDKGSKSHRGILRKEGGSGVGYPGIYPNAYRSGKLGGYRTPYWPYGNGNIRIIYTAGYKPTEIPADLKYAASMLAAFMVKSLPNGIAVGSETLGAYSYTVLSTSSDKPELGELTRTLAPYREISW